MRDRTHAFRLQQRRNPAFAPKRPAPLALCLPSWRSGRRPKTGRGRRATRLNGVLARIEGARQRARENRGRQKPTAGPGSDAAAWAASQRQLVSAPRGARHRRYDGSPDHKEHPQPAPQVKVPSYQREGGEHRVRPSPQRQPGPTEHGDLVRPVAGSWLRGWRAGQPQRLGRCRSAPRAARRPRGCCASLEPAERYVERSHRRRLEKTAFEFKSGARLAHPLHSNWQCTTVSPAGSNH